MSLLKGKVVAITSPSEKSVTDSRTPQERVASIFRHMPDAFISETAKEWKAVLHWEIAGTGDFTLTTQNGVCNVAESKEGKPTCIVRTDTDTFLGITDGTIDGNQAFMTGKISASNVRDLLKYQKAFAPNRASPATETAKTPETTATSQTLATSEEKPGGASPTDRSVPATYPALDTLDAQQRLAFLLGFLPRFVPPSENLRPLTMHLRAGSLACTLRASADGLDVEPNHTGTPTARVVGDPESLWSLFTGGDATKLVQNAKITTTSMNDLRQIVAWFGENPEKELASELDSRGSGINRSAIGRVVEGDPIVVSEQEILDFATATNDPNPHFVDTSRKEGIVAPPLFAVRFFNQLYVKVVTDPSLEINVGRLLFGEMEMRYLSPIRPGDQVFARVTVLNIEDKETGQVMRLRSQLICEGDVKVDAVASWFVRWEKKPKIKRLASPSADPSETDLPIAFEDSTVFLENQTQLFAMASNDPNPVHLDANFAKAFGFPGVIVHGLCSMAFCSKAFVSKATQGDPRKLQSLKVRFSKPALPGQKLTTRAFKPKEVEDQKIFNFVAVNNKAQLIITDGIAVIS